MVVESVILGLGYSEREGIQVLEEFKLFALHIQSSRYTKLPTLGGTWGRALCTVLRQ